MSDNVKWNRKVLGHAAEYLAASGIRLSPGIKIHIEVRETHKKNEHLVVVSDDAGTKIGAFFERAPKAERATT
jgi:hypothetical protein